VNHLSAASQKPVFPQISFKPVSLVLPAVFKIFPRQPQHAIQAQIKLINAFHEDLQFLFARLNANLSFHEDLLYRATASLVKPNRGRPSADTEPPLLTARCKTRMKRHTSIDDQTDAVDVIGIIRGQPHCGAGDVFRLADSFIRYQFHKLIIGLLRLPGLPKQITKISARSQWCRYSAVLSLNGKNRSAGVLGARKNRNAR